MLWCWLSAGQSSSLASPLCFQAGLLGDVCKGSYFGVATLLFWLIQNNPPIRKLAWNKRDFALSRAMILGQNHGNLGFLLPVILVFSL